jgi:hypothetical protein
VLLASSQLLFSSEISSKCFPPLLLVVGLKVHLHQVFLPLVFSLSSISPGPHIQTLNRFRIKQFKLFLLKFVKKRS